MSKPFLCLIGLHSKRTTMKFEPSIAAPIVEAMEVKTWCSRCGQVFSLERHEWDGEEFREAPAEVTP